MHGHEDWFPVSHESSSESNQRPERRGGADQEDLLDAYSRAVVDVVRAVSPAVVSIQGVAGGQSQEGGGASGAGFVVRSDGLAVTNSHVVSGRSHLMAETSDGDRVSATVLGDDAATDLALLRLEARDLPHAEIGDSAALQPGQLVIAMGSPLGLHSTVSTGVVSAVGRGMRNQFGRLIEDVVQHTAPINPGNSGGPLVDSRGRVVGVNTAIILGAQGIGFAVPSNAARWVTGELLEHGRVRRRRLGVSAAAERLPKALVRELDLVSDSAVRIVDVTPGSAAELAGVRPGDLLIAINDRLTSNVDDVHRLLARIPGEAEAELTLARRQELIRLTLGRNGADG